MGVGNETQQAGPTQQGVPVRAVSFEEVLEARWDITTSQLLERVIVAGKGFEVELAKMDMGLVRFRSRAYRYATSRELQAHVVQDKARPGIVWIYSHKQDDECKLCKEYPPRS